MLRFCEVTTGKVHSYDADVQNHDADRLVTLKYFLRQSDISPRAKQAAKMIAGDTFNEKYDCIEINSKRFATTEENRLYTTSIMEKLIREARICVGEKVRPSPKPTKKRKPDPHNNTRPKQIIREHAKEPQEQKSEAPSEIRHKKRKRKCPSPSARNHKRTKPRGERLLFRCDFNSYYHRHEQPVGLCTLSGILISLFHFFASRVSQPSLLIPCDSSVVFFCFLSSFGLLLPKNLFTA